LNKLPQLHTAVTESHKYGNPVVLGFQGRSQLEKRYGQDAEAMLSQPATKIFFKTSAPRAAKWISEAIGRDRGRTAQGIAQLGPAPQQEPPQE
jgi:type IV secretory pathway TraG/TraD family ATPase VirD4